MERKVTGKTPRVNPGTPYAARGNPVFSLLVTPLLLLVLWLWLAFLLVAMALLAPVLWFMDWRDKRRGVPPFNPDPMR